MFEQTVEQWAERAREFIDEAYDDGYVIFAEPSGTDDINLMIGHRYYGKDVADSDVFVSEISI